MRRVNTILTAVRSILNLVVAFVLVFVILSAAGVNLKILLATAGIVGVIVGLAAQSSIRAFIAGMTFVISDRFSIGDFVTFELAGPRSVRGLVTGFSTQATTLQDFAGGKYFVPNNNIEVVVNYSQNEQRAQVDLHIAYDNDIDTVLARIQELIDAMATSETIRDNMTQPPVIKGVTANDAHSYTISVAAIAAPMAQIVVERYMRYRLIRLLEQLGIPQVSPSRIEHVHKPPDDGANEKHADADASQAMATNTGGYPTYAPGPEANISATARPRAVFGTGHHTPREGALPVPGSHTDDIFQPRPARDEDIATPFRGQRGSGRLYRPDIDIARMPEYQE